MLKKPNLLAYTVSGCKVIICFVFFSCTFQIKCNLKGDFFPLPALDNYVSYTLFEMRILTNHPGVDPTQSLTPSSGKVVPTSQWQELSACY